MELETAFIGTAGAQGHHVNGRLDPQVNEYFMTRGAAELPPRECEPPYFGVGCKRRGCEVSIGHRANYFANSVDALFSPCLAADGAGCSHSYGECGSAGVCDYATGVCKCARGFMGAGCRYRDCPRSEEDGQVCSGHGTCATADYVVDGEESGAAEYAAGLTTAQREARHSLQCTCDAG